MAKGKFIGQTTNSFRPIIEETNTLNDVQQNTRLNDEITSNNNHVSLDSNEIDSLVGIQSNQPNDEPSDRASSFKRTADDIMLSDDDEDDDQLPEANSIKVPKATNLKVEQEASFKNDIKTYEKDEPSDRKSLERGRQTELVADDRLTLLQDPDQDNWIHLDSQAVISPNTEPQATMASVNRSLTSSKAPALIEPASLRPEPRQVMQQRSSAELALIGITCSIALLWLLGLVVFSWMEMRRRRRRRKRSIDDQRRQGADGWLHGCLGDCLSPDDGKTDERQSSGDSLGAERSRLVAAGQEGDRIVVEEEPSAATRHDSSIVILQRRIARSSLVAGARSTKPKVRLLKARVRRFIDDEARELQNNQSNQSEASKPLWSRLYSYCVISLARNKQQSDETAEPETIELKETAAQTGAQSPRETHGLSSRLALAEANQAVDLQKLTPSPVLNNPDGCSSVSACSLFSSSPIEQLNGNLPSAAPCGCRVAGSALFAGPLLVQDEGRSRSQGHSPACRQELDQSCQPPCCSSVSPSALSSYPFQPSSVQTKQAMALGHSPRPMNAGQQLEPMLANCQQSDQLTVCLNEKRITCGSAVSSRIKRQYENYYDDERGDAYRRLTASIGMDFGLGGNICHLANSANALQPNLEQANHFAMHHHQLCATTSYMPPTQASSHMYVSHPLPVYNCSCHLPSSQQLCYQPFESVANHQLRCNWAAPLGTGSAGELPTSDSASLGGSDSGFASVAVPFNQSGSSCRCQSDQRRSSVERPTAEPATSHLFAPLTRGQHSPETSIANDELPSKAKPKETSLPASNKSRRAYLVRGQRATFKGSAIWRHRQHHNWHRALGDRTSLSLRDSRNPRRMSIAGDQLRCPANWSAATCDANHAALSHRASIASDGSCSQQQTGATDPLCRQLACRNHEHYHLLNSRSQYSSSNGSSSGIGFSGSTCTNTPTSVYQPYGGFSPKACQEPPIAGCQQQQQQPVMVYGYQLPQSSISNRPPANCLGCLEDTPIKKGHEQSCKLAVGQMVSCPNRKFSLPVQLESQAAERLSPNKSRLLFEKNLQRVDSSSLSQANTSQASRSQQVDSRRSSQSITRQSSFWIEDNTADSILSLNMPTMSNCAATEDSSVCQDTSGETVAQDAYKVQSQRPSLSSLVQSGESIESVKRRPSTNAPLPAPQLASTEATEKVAQPQRQESSDLPSEAGSINRPASDTRRRRAKYHSFFHHKSRLSSSSSNSTSSTSSPSPDFGRLPSAKILGLASRSGSIAKRHPPTGCFLRSNRLSKFGNHSLEPARKLLRLTRQQQSAPAEILASFRSRELEETSANDGKPLDELDQFDVNLVAFNPLQSTRQLPERHGDQPADSSSVESKLEVSSASLERQCRDLWKLRATLHKDSCITDDWANYHKRLNRRYDSGYKSIENQLSSSIEGGAILAANIQALRKDSPTALVQAQAQRDPDERPQSGCSMFLAQDKRSDGQDKTEDQPQSEPTGSEKLDIIAQYQAIEAGNQETRFDCSRAIDEATPLLATIDTQATDRSESRSSKSSNDEAAADGH